jgi:hypothetical protein
MALRSTTVFSRAYSRRLKDARGSTGRLRRVRCPSLAREAGTSLRHGVKTTDSPLHSLSDAHLADEDQTNVLAESLDLAKLSAHNQTSSRLKSAQIGNRRA